MGRRIGSKGWEILVLVGGCGFFLEDRIFGWFLDSGEDLICDSELGKRDNVGVGMEGVI